MLQLARATAPDVDRDLLVAARLIWASVFGTPRPGRGAKPLVRCKQSPQGIRSAAAWLRRRRQHVADRSAAAAGAEPSSTTDQAVQAAAEAAWTDRHSAEERFPEQRSGLSTNVPMSTTGSLPDAPWAPEPSKH